MFIQLVFYVIYLYPRILTRLRCFPEPPSERGQRLVRDNLVENLALLTTNFTFTAISTGHRRLTNLLAGIAAQQLKSPPLIAAKAKTEPDTPISEESIRKRREDAQRRIDRGRIPIPKDSVIPEIQPDLPRSELRALFALHHAAQNFIHRDNLDAAIDAAFLHANTQNYHHARRIEMRLSDLEERLQKNRQQDKFIDGLDQEVVSMIRRQTMSHAVHGGKGTRWDAPPMNSTKLSRIQSATMTIDESRDRAVRAALFGMEAVGKEVKPGLEAVEEHLAAEVLKENFAHRLQNEPSEEALKGRIEVNKPPITWRGKRPKAAKASR